ncbi:MAG: RpoL/Rpb11 RNA polymerase subunit family protein [Candidatus Ranarchaeia archaeon]
MRLKILEKTSNSILFEVYGERHTFGNLLRSALLQEKNTKDAAYFIKHPELDPPRIFLQTTGKQSPMKILRASIKKLNNELTEFQTQFRAALAKFERAS